MLSHDSIKYKCLNVLFIILGEMPTNSWFTIDILKVIYCKENKSNHALDDSVDFYFKIYIICKKSSCDSNIIHVIEA
jgi:hypothetical protein